MSFSLSRVNNQNVSIQDDTNIAQLLYKLEQAEQRLAALERQEVKATLLSSSSSSSSSSTSPRWTQSPILQGSVGGVGDSAMDIHKPVVVQGGSLKTWSFLSPSVQRLQVTLSSEGRPVNADLELWQGPDNTPQKMLVYSEHGRSRPINITIETPHAPNTIAIRNTGQMEFPLSAQVDTDDADEPLAAKLALRTESRMTIQGGALRTFPFDSTVESVQVLLMTDGRPLNARIELLQGPNNNKQVMEVYTEDGRNRPFCAVIEAPGVGNVVRIVNTATVEFPLYAWVAPFQIATPRQTSDVTTAVLGGGDGSLGFMTHHHWHG